MTRKSKKHGWSATVGKNSNSRSSSSSSTLWLGLFLLPWVHSFDVSSQRWCLSSLSSTTTARCPAAIPLSQSHVRRYDSSAAAVPPPRTRLFIATPSQKYEPCDDDGGVSTNDKDSSLSPARRTSPPPKQPQQRRRVNEAVRQHLQFLQERLSDETDADDSDDAARWKKCKAYLYRTSGRTLTLVQIQRVVDTLLQYNPSLLDRGLVRHVVQSSPRVLRKHARTYIQPTLEFLHERFGDALLPQALQRNPNLLLTRDTGYNVGGASSVASTSSLHPPPDDWELIPIYLRHELGMTDTQIKTLQRQAPRIFQMPVSKVIHNTSYLLDVLLAPQTESHNNDIDNSDNDDDIDNERTNDSHAASPTNVIQEGKRILVKTIMAHPSLLQLSVKDNLQPRIAYLQERCQLQPSDMATLVKSCRAGILGLSVNDNLAAKLDLLQDLLTTNKKSKKNNNKDVDRTKLRTCLLRHAQILGLRKEHLQTKIEHFNALHPRLASRLLERTPAVYSLSWKDNLQPKIDFLAHVWGVTTANHHRTAASIDNSRAANNNNHDKMPALSSLLYENPTILTLSLDGNLRPTVDFYNRTGYIDLDSNYNLQDPTQVGLLRGRYLAASLYNRLLPRWHFAQTVASSTEPNAWGNDDNPTSSGRQQVPLHLLVSGSDMAFCQAMDTTVEAYSAFKQETLPRLKFSDQFANWLKTGRPIEV